MNETRGSQPGDGSRLTDPHALSVPQRVYMWLSTVLVTCLLVANVVGVKLFRVELDLGPLGLIPVEHTVGMLPFPMTFLLTDLLNEYFGKKAARRTTYIAFVMGGLAFAMYAVARKAPILEGIPGTATQGAFENVFGAATLMYLASLGAFLFGSLLDIFLFGVFKRFTGGRYVWFRATGSTVISQLFDSFLVTFFFFYVAQVLTGGESASFGFIFRTALTGYVLKFVIAVAMTPLIYLGRWMLSRWFGLVPIPASGA
ncbi:MAG: queuosine precursor transporter [Phycisphaerae bacterium]|nr:queuosine precursor transporter [Phycisphaerae bacterium]